MTTEARNPDLADIDQMSTLEIVQRMNREDAKCIAAVASVEQPLAAAIDAMVARMRRGGRLIYLGAGTSGRLGVLDAAECPPTFSTPPELVIGVIAGGPSALTRAVEGAEDRAEEAERDLALLNLSPRDVLVAIASSGRTPFALAGTRYARAIGALTVGIVCNRDSALSALVDHRLELIVGPEVITGSTRLKAGTATKMALNMISTAVMIRLGKTYGNWMVDLRATNGKLRERAVRMVSAITGLDTVAAEQLLAACEGEVKTAIVAELSRCSPAEARQRLTEVAGHVRSALRR